MGGRGSGGHNRKKKQEHRVRGYAGKRTSRRKQKRDRETAIVEVSSGPLGLAPRHLTKEEKKVWYELSAIVPIGVAEASDRWAFELLVCLMRKFRSGYVKAGEVTQISNLLARFGMTPADRGRANPRPQDPAIPKKADPWADFAPPARPQ